MSTKAFRAALFVALALAPAACGGSADSGVTIEIAADPQAQATHFVFDWFDGDRTLFTGRRVPAAGTISGGGAITVRVEVAAGVRGSVRRAVVRGMRGADIEPVSEGTGMVSLGLGGWRTMPVDVLLGRRPDRDGDAVPDEIDLCPDDPALNGPCGGEDGGADAGVADGASADRPRADQASDGSGADAADAAADGGDQRPGDAPDAGAMPSPDAAIDGARDGSPPPPDSAPDVTVDGPRPITCGTVLLVGSGGTERGDRLINTRLKDMGCMVVVRDDDALVTADATGKALVVISDTVTPSKVGNKLRTVPVPVLNFEPLLLDDMSMTGPVENTDWARNLPETHVAVLDAGHPLAGGLSGSVPLFADPDPVGWGKPDPAGAIRVASVVNNIAQLVIFAYDARAPTVTPGFVAPARRVAFNVNETAFAKLTQNGWTLFDAAVRWSLGVN